MEKDENYWANEVLPSLFRLKEKQAEARELLEKMIAIAYDKAGYMKVRTAKGYEYVPKQRYAIVMSSELKNNWGAHYHLIRIKKEKERRAKHDTEDV